MYSTLNLLMEASSLLSRGLAMAAYATALYSYTVNHSLNIALQKKQEKRNLEDLSFEHAQ